MVQPTVLRSDTLLNVGEQFPETYCHTAQGLGVEEKIAADIAQNTIKCK